MEANHEGKCIVIVAHITDSGQSTVLDNCIQRLRKHAPKYPILLSVTGDIHLIKNRLGDVNHFLFTNLNTLNVIESPLSVFYQTSAWSIIYNIPAPRYYYGFAQLQKTAIALEGAMSLGYTQFLVMNYDAYLMEDGFVDYMFSEQQSIFFNFINHQIRMSSDVFKLDMIGARAVISLVEDAELYHSLAAKCDGHMLEDVLGLMVQHYNIPYRKLSANATDMFQINPFKVLINNSYNEGAMAASIDGKLHLLITSQGHPRFTLDNKLEVGYNGNFTTFDLSVPTSILYPITDYTGNDVEIVVRTSFNESVVVLRKNVIENTTVIFH
jgi:hypothetical protein